MDIWRTAFPAEEAASSKAPETGRLALSVEGPVERQLLLVGNWQAVGGEVRITGDWNTRGCGCDSRDSG